MTQGFSERTFEFCFNAGYCRANAALLASHPHIPSQKIEKDLGYDVEFKIKHGSYTRSLFLQHKVPSFASVRAGRNAKFFDAQKGPYYRFSVDNHQHNTLCDLSKTKGNAFYCAPVFHQRVELEKHFFANTVCSSSMLLDPQQVGTIGDLDRHNITFNPKGQNAILHSEPRRFEQEYRGGGDLAPPLERVEVTPRYVEQLSDQLMSKIQAERLGPSLRQEIDASKPTRKVQLILARVYDVSWLLLP